MLCAILSITACTPVPDSSTDSSAAEQWPSDLVAPIEGATFPLAKDHFPGAPRDYDAAPHHGFKFSNGLSGRPLADNEPVVAVADGEIIRIDRAHSEMGSESLAFWSQHVAEPGFVGEYALDQLRGRQVWILHEEGHISRYAHLSEVHPELEPGDAVEQGQPVGLMGNSGLAPTDEPLRNAPYLHFELWSPQGERYLGQDLSPLETHQLVADLFGPDSLPRYARQVLRRVNAGQEAPEAYPPEEFSDAGFNINPPDSAIAGAAFAIPISWEGDTFRVDDFFAYLEGGPLGIIDAGDGAWILGAAPLESEAETLDLVIGAIDPYGQTLMGQRPIALQARKQQLPPIERDPTELARYTEQNLETEAQKLAPVHAQSLSLREAKWQEPFQPPIQGSIVGVFGQKSVHGVHMPAHPLPGLEIIPDEGVSEVLAANTGIVALAEQLPIRGETVALIHGGGVVTIYAKLNEIGVAVGDEVRQGEPLGTVGQGGESEDGKLRTEIHVAGHPSNPAMWANQVLPTSQ